MHKLIFCGDFCLAAGSNGDRIYSSAIENSPLSSVLESFGDDAFIAANIEAAVTNRCTGRQYKWANLRMDPSKQFLLKGLSLAILGNNHVGDFGEQGVLDTIKFLENMKVLHVGTGNTLEEAFECSVFNVSDVKIAVISLCCPSTNSEYIATHQSPGVAPLSVAILRRAINKAKKLADLVILYAHWGCEWVHDPSPDQVRMARYAINLGADAVVGCHSHTIQSFEKYKNKWIFYGLGNYIFDAGYAQVLQDDGSIKSIPLNLEMANRESLVVSFAPRIDSGKYMLELERIQPYRFDENYTPFPIELSELSFDIRAANSRLALAVKKYQAWLQSADEPEFISRLLNGSAMAYWYRYPSFENLSSVSVGRKKFLPSLCKRVLRKIKNFSLRLNWLQQ